MKIFLMCQGRGTRWNSNRLLSQELPSEIKQLIPIGKEPLICRTLRQLKGLDVTIVGLNQYFGKYHKKIYTVSEPSGCLIDGILKTEPLWGECGSDVLFLLGDVVYSNYAIWIILSGLYNNHKPYNLYGRLSGNLYTGKWVKEMFALHFKVNNTVFEVMMRLSKSNENAKLWDLYSVCRSIIPIADWTDDIDTPEEYKRYGKILEERVLQDDQYSRKNS